MKSNLQPIEGFSLTEILDTNIESTDQIVTLVPLNYINAIWPDVESLLKGGADRTSGRWDIKSLHFAIASGEQQLWVTFNTDNKITNALTTEIVEYPNKVSLAIQFAGGDDGQANPDTMDIVLNKLENYAKDVGCHCIELWGRKGFSKKLKKSGYEESLVFYEKEITYD